MSDQDKTTSSSPPKSVVTTNVKFDDDNSTKAMSTSPVKSDEENSTKASGKSPVNWDDENSTKSEGILPVISDNSSALTSTSPAKSDEDNSTNSSDTPPSNWDDENSTKSDGKSPVKSDDENSSTSTSISPVKSDEENSTNPSVTLSIQSDGVYPTKTVVTTNLKSADENPANTMEATPKMKQSVLLISSNQGSEIWEMNENDALDEIDKSFPKDVGSYYHSVCVCKYKESGLIVTGGVDSKACHKWTALSKTWERLQDMLRGRYYHVSICTEDKLLVIGGIAEGSNWSQAVYEMDLGWCTWRELEGHAMPIVLSCLNVAQIKPHIYVLGNLDTSLNAGLLRLETKPLGWSRMEGIDDAGSDFSLAAYDSKLLVAGGSKQICKSYNPLTDVWSNLTPPFCTHISGSMVFFNGKVMIVGGHTSAIEKYNLTEKSWSVSDVDLPEELDRLTALVLDIPEN